MKPPSLWKAVYYSMNQEGITKSSVQLLNTLSCYSGEKVAIKTKLASAPSKLLSVSKRNLGAVIFNSDFA